MRKRDSLRTLGTKEKALQLNLLPEIYGTFAEIGAGQEVAAHFFKAGRASGSIAKTMSAYDMTFSDAIYGACKRYVCRERLYQMLEKEYSLLTRRLSFRSKKTKFFAFANTIKTGDRTQAGEGWIGVRFQLHPNTEPNDCVIHVILKDKETEWQQQALGAVGVNLLYACHFHYDESDAFILSLVDNIPDKSVEVDMFSLSGPDFESHIDNRLMSLKLVKHQLTRAAMFGPDGHVIQPSEMLYEKDVLVLRGRFRPVTLVSVDMMIACLKQFRQEPKVDAKNIVRLLELTLNDLEEKGEINEYDFLDRVEVLCSLGQNVLISNYHPYYQLSEYLSQKNGGHTLGIILGYNNLMRIFDPKYYQELRGGMVEAFGRLYGPNTKLYVYPYMDKDKSLKRCSDATFDGPSKSLFQYYYGQGKIEDIAHANRENLHIISDHVLAMIQEGKSGWEKYVPHKVSRAIKTNHLFNYPAPATLEAEE